MRDILIAACLLLAVVVVSAKLMAAVECHAGPKIGSKIIIQGC